MPMRNGYYIGEHAYKQYDPDGNLCWTALRAHVNNVPELLTFAENTESACKLEVTSEGILIVLNLSGEIFTRYDWVICHYDDTFSKMSAGTFEKMFPPPPSPKE